MLQRVREVSGKENLSIYYLSHFFLLYSLECFSSFIFPLYSTYRVQLYWFQDLVYPQSLLNKTSQPQLRLFLELSH